ncbi:MAG: ABC transporter permease [Chloroflexota bacterium]|nr:MAG: ABC transporter permease [Chloroflexota bacterium]
MRIDYVLRRFGIFLLIVWAASTLNFILPRLRSTNPIREKLIEQALLGGYAQQGMQQMVEEYERKFGLNEPLWKQYITYLVDVFRFDLNYSISNYPRTVTSMMAEALPWTIGLLLTTTLLSFAIGTLLGAFLGWPRAPRWLQFMMPPLLALHAIPFFLLGLLLIYVFTFEFRLLPEFGGYTGGTLPDASLAFALDVVIHAILPALSIILVSIGGWALGMRAMMVTTQGEDFAIFAEAKGLKPRTLFLNYAIRNAMLPQATALALVLGHILSGAVLVEVIFGYPGIGNILFNAIRQSDYYLIQGIVFGVIVSLGIATFILDLIYPFLDPRISYRKA